MRCQKGCSYYLIEFEELKRNHGELVVDFIKLFNKLYHKMPPNCKPPVAATKVRFSKAFDDDFAVMLRERISPTLQDMQTKAIEVEANSSTSSKLNAKVEKDERKMKAKEEGSSSNTKNDDQKMDEITSLLRNLSNRISKIETQPRTIQQTTVRPQNQLRRAPQTQILQRPNTDKQIQPPLMIDDQQSNDIGPLISEDINNFDSTSVYNNIVPHPTNQSSQNQEDNQIFKY